MKAVHSPISLKTKIRLYNLSGPRDGADAPTPVYSRRLDAFDQWCLRRIIRIPYITHVTNDEVRHRTNQRPVTSTITARRRRLFGHIARVDPSQDHSRALRTAINRPPAERRQRTG